MTIELYENGKCIQTFHELYFGKNGCTSHKQEGDMCTPKGEFQLGFAFGTESLETTYPYYKLKDNIYWVSDPNSEYYNEWVEVTDKKITPTYSYMKTAPHISWSSAEHLSEYPIQYELALVIEYNISPKKKNAGSAIFFHVKKGEYTAGCIATTKENQIKILNWLEKGKAKIIIQ